MNFNDFMQQYQPVPPSKLKVGSTYTHFQGIGGGDAGKTSRVKVVEVVKVNPKRVVIYYTTASGLKQAMLYDGRPWTSLCEKKK